MESSSDDNNHVHSLRRRLGDSFVLVLCVPFLGLAVFAALSGAAAGSKGAKESPQPAATAGAKEATKSPQPTAAADPSGRLVMVIVDSLRQENLETDALMPSLYALTQRPGTTFVKDHTCKANFTLPCVQTMLEGRQSPFVAGLNNFTGQSGSRHSLPATLSAAGHPIGLISDHTLDSLYGPVADISINVESWADQTHLEDDLKSINRGQQMLDEGAIDALFLHIVGTDKAAHHFHPDTPRYHHEFRAVDRALASFIDTLDLDRDSLVIVGDHGHGPRGNHNHKSVAIFAGRRFETLFGQLPPIDQIEQTDLLYFLSYPLLLPLPTSYEGHIFEPDEPRGYPAKYLDVQRNHLNEAGVSETASVRAAMAQLRQNRQAHRYDPVAKYAPLLLLFALFVAQLVSSLRRTPTVHARRVLLTYAAAAVPVALVADPTRGPWLCLPIAVGGIWAAWRQRAMRGHLMVAMLVAMAAFTGKNASQWAHYFHTIGGFKPALIVFYAMMLAGGLTLAGLFFSGLRRLGYGAAAVAFFGLPSGLYYYQSAQNILFGCFVGSALVGLVVLARHRRRITDWLAWINAPAAVSICMTGLAAVLLIIQEAGGWSWHLQAVWWLQNLGPAATWSVLAMMGGYCIWVARTRTRRTVVGGFFVGAALFCVMLGELPVAKFTAAMLPTLFVAALLDVRRRAQTDGPSLLDRPDQPTLALHRGLMAAGLIFVSMWIATSGFLLQNVDFSFAIDWFGQYFRREKDIFIPAYVVTTLKYALPATGVLVALRCVGERADFRPAFWGIIAWFDLELLTLLIQVFAGSTAHSEKYSELTLSSLVFVYALVTALVASFGVLWLADRAMVDEPGQ